jgi:hypothetical protein
MICFAKPVLTEDLYTSIVQNEEFLLICYMGKNKFDERPSIFIRDKTIFFSERMLHKEYYRKGSVKKNSLVVSLKELNAKTN